LLRYDIDYLTLERMVMLNERDKMKGKLVSASRYQGDRHVFSYNQTKFRHEMYNEVLVNDSLTNEFKIQYPHTTFTDRSRDCALCSLRYELSKSAKCTYGSGVSHTPDVS
jgi:hypothetical protein